MERTPGAGLLAPLQLHAGARILEIGCHEQALAPALVESGAEVTLFEPHRDHAQAARDAWGGTATIETPASGGEDWLARTDAFGSKLDLFIINAVPSREDEDDAARLASLIEVASRTLGADGTLVLFIDNPWGLRHMLGGTKSPGVDSPRLRVGRATSANLLNTQGWRGQRWLLPYPGLRDPSVIVDAALWDIPGGPEQIQNFVRRPLVDPDPGQLFISDPVGAFRAASESGIAADVADHYMIAASRRGSENDINSAEGLLWLVASAQRQVEWRCSRVLRAHGTGWRLGPAQPHSSARSGPLMLRCAEAEVPVGINAEDMLVAALTDPAGSSAEAAEVVQRWWRAASATIAVASDDEHHFDVRPRDFIVTADGTWRHLPGCVVHRFAVPPMVLAYRAMFQLLREAVLPRSRLVGYEPTLSVDEAVRGLLGSIDIDRGDELSYLWTEFEADVAIRTGATDLDRDAFKTNLWDSAAQRLWSATSGAPLDRQIQDIVSGVRAKDVEAVGGKLDELVRTERLAREALHDQAAQAQDATARIQELDRAMGVLQRQLHERNLEVEAARSEGDGLRRQLHERNLEVEAARSEGDGLRRQLHERNLEVEAVATASLWTEFQSRFEEASAARSKVVEGEPLAIDQERELVVASDLFDADWYLSTYPDIAHSEIDPAFHYVRHGAGEGRDPGPSFSSRAYVLQNPDVARDGDNPLVHQIRQAGGETRTDTGTAPSTDTISSSREAHDPLIPASSSEQDYLSAVARAEPWLAVAELICQREAISRDGPLEHVSRDNRYPAIVVPPSHVIKLYSHWQSGHEVMATEIAALKRFRRDPALPVPRYIASGELDEDWRYIVMTRVPGVDYLGVEPRLRPGEMIGVAGWLGRFIRQLHAVPLEPAEREAGWDRFSSWTESLRSRAVGDAAASEALPSHLQAKLDDWLPSVPELLGSAQDAVPLHGDLTMKHVLGREVAGRFVPSGVIDLNDSIVGHPLYDVGKLWRCGFGGERKPLETFLAEAKIPGTEQPSFPRMALAWSFVRTCTDPPAWPDLDAVESLDELAMRSFGGLDV